MNSRRIERLWAFATGACLSLAVGTVSVQALPEAASTGAAAQRPIISVGGGGTSDGQVKQNLPLGLPPARLMPQLALDYSSDRGDSDVGRGWILAGIPTITRSMGRDGARLDVEDDDYLVDGVPLLRLPGDPLSSLRFRRWGDISGTEYQLDREHNRWIETTRGGLVRHYQMILTQGSTAYNPVDAEDGPVALRRSSGTKTQAQREAMGHESDRALIWALQLEENQYGDQVHYFYSYGASLGSMPLLSEIRYGGNVRLGTQPHIVVQVGRYQDAVPSLMTTVAPRRAIEGRAHCDNPLISDAPVSYRWGGALTGTQGRRIWGIGWAVADGSTTDADAFAAVTSLRGMVALHHSYDRGCRNTDELHDNLERIEWIGFNPQTGAAETGAVKSFEYYGWDRHWTGIPGTLPPHVAVRPPSAAMAAAFPSLSTTMPSDPALLDDVMPSETAMVGNYKGHWPQGWRIFGITGEQLPYCRRGISCDTVDEAAAPSAVQMLRDENGDAIPDYVDLLAGQICNRGAATGSPPLVAYGTRTGEFNGASPLAWADPIMKSHQAGGGTVQAFCGAELWRGVVGSAYPSNEASPTRVGFIGISGNESAHIDVDADGYPDVLRLIGSSRLWASYLTDPPRAAADQQWQWYRKDPATLSYSSTPVPVGNVPWVESGTGLPAMLLLSPMQNVSASVKVSASRSGFDYASTELASMVDLTGDGVPDRLGAMSVPGLRNQPTVGAPVVREGWALVLYRGRLVPQAADGAATGYRLTFSTTPEYWWTRAEGGIELQDGDPDQLAPATSASIRARCYGEGASGCEEESIGVSALMDMNGDGLPDIVTAQPKLNAFFAGYGGNEIDGGGNYTLNPLAVLYNTGRGFTYAPMWHGGSPEPIPHHTGHMRMAADGDGDHVQEEQVLEQWVDFNGDGLVDLLQPHGVRINRGDGSVSEPLQVEMPAPTAGGYLESAKVIQLYRWEDLRTTRGETLKITDMNADGRPDWLQVNQVTRQTMLYTDRDMGAAPGRMKTAKDGLGGETSYRYQTLEYALRASGDARGVPHKQFVLASVSARAGSNPASGPEQTVEYEYSEGHFGRSSIGRDDGELAQVQAGFQGFGKVTARWGTGKRVTQRYGYDWGREAILVAEEEYATGGVLLTRTQYEYDSVPFLSRSIGGGGGSAVYVQPRADAVLLRSVTQETRYEARRGFYDPTPVRTRTRYEYQPDDPLADFGAPWRVYQEGDLDDPADDVVVETHYAHGQWSDARGTFRNSVLADTQTFVTDGSGPPATLASHVRYDYDCNPDVAVGTDRCPVMEVRTVGRRVDLVPVISRGQLRQQVVYTDAEDASKVLRTHYYYTESDGLLQHVKSPEGRVSSVCYDARHQVVVASRAPDGQRYEYVYDLGSGARVETRGPVNLSPLPLAGAPGANSNTSACPKLNREEPDFGGLPPTIPPWPEHKAQASLPVPEAQRPPAPPVYRTWSDPSGPPPVRHSAAPYSYSDNPIATALRARRNPVPDLGITHAERYLRLPWLINGVHVPALPLRITPSSPVPPVLSGRTLVSPTQHVVYDGLGRVLSTHVTSSRDVLGNYVAVQLSAYSQWFGDGTGGSVEGVQSSRFTLVAGDGLFAPNAKIGIQNIVQDGYGQTLWHTALLGGAHWLDTRYAYGVRGNLERTMYQDPQVAGGWLISEASDYDDRDAPRTQRNSAGLVVRADRRISWRDDGPHFITQNYGGGDGVVDSANARIAETEWIPRARTAITRRYTQAAGMRAIEERTVYGKLGEVDYVINPEGQVTRYLRDLAGRMIYVGRFNSVSDMVARKPLEETDIHYPDYDAPRAATEQHRTIHTHYAADGTPAVAQVTRHLNWQTGQLEREESTLSADAEARAAEGPTNYTYITDPAQDGYGQMRTITSAAGTTILGYDAMQRQARVERRYQITWPGSAAQLIDTWVYRTEYEPTGLVRRTHIEMAGPRVFSTRYEYDEAGHLVALYDENASPDVAAESYEYTHTGQLWKRHDRRGGTQTLGYDHYGQLKESALEALVFGGSGRFNQSVVRDALTGFPNAIHTTFPDGTVGTVGYKYNAAGQLTQVRDSEGSSVYNADIEYRCTATGACDERFDVVHEYLPLAGNRALRYHYADAYDATQLAHLADRDTGTAVRAYRYDAAGARIGDGTLIVRNNPFGEPAHHERGGYLDVLGGSLHYRKTTGEQAPSVLYLQLPGMQVEYARSAMGLLVHQVVRRQIGTETLEVIGPQTGQQTWLDEDVLGNATVMRRYSGSAGEAAFARYTAFGETLFGRTSPAFSNAWFGYKYGRVDQSGVGLIQFGARFYDPWSKQFTTRDPLRMGATANTSAYDAFSNNPIVMSDPTGLQSEPVQPNMSPMQNVMVNWGQYLEEKREHQNDLLFIKANLQMRGGRPTADLVRPSARPAEVRPTPVRLPTAQHDLQGRMGRDPMMQGAAATTLAAGAAYYAGGAAAASEISLFSRFGTALQAAGRFIGSLGFSAGGAAGSPVPGSRNRAPANNPGGGGNPGGPGGSSTTGSGGPGGSPSQPEPLRVANLGCGPEPRIEELTWRYPAPARIVLIEPDASALNLGVRVYARANGGLPANVATFPTRGQFFPQRSLDRVYVENISPTYVNGELEAARMLQPGGQALITYDGAPGADLARINRVQQQLQAEGFQTQLMGIDEALHVLPFDPRNSISDYVFQYLLEIRAPPH